MNFNTLVEYRDDFEDEAVGQRPSHWIEPASFDGGMESNYRVFRKFGGKVYGTQDVSGPTMSYLHVFEREPELELDFYVGAHEGPDAEIGFVFRMAPQETFVKIGYRMAEQKWLLFQDRADGSEPTVTEPDGNCVLQPDTRYHLRAWLEGSGVYFEVNGERIFWRQRARLTCDGYGRLGVYTNKAQLYIDNVRLMLPSGVLPNDGVLEFIFGEPEVGFSATQTVSMGEGRLIAVSNKGRRAYSSDDWGSTWKEITKTEGAELLSTQQGYQNMLKLRDGTYLAVRDWCYEVYRSPDMLHWKKTGAIPVPYGKLDPDVNGYVDDFGRRIYLGHVQSMVQFTLADGTERIFYPLGHFGYASDSDTEAKMGSRNMRTLMCYSDDNGETWQIAPGDSTAFDFDYVDERHLGSWGEAKLIQCPDGVIRMYSSRPAAPMLHYTESDDGGMTWHGLHAIPEMQKVESSISIVEDPYDPGVYYALWVNDLRTISRTGGFRTRLSMARSTDGKNWEFVTDLERMVVRYNSDPTQKTALFQIIDPNLMITKDYFYIDFGRSVGLKANKISEIDGLALAHGHVGRWFLRLERSKLAAPKPWNVAYLANPHLPKSLTVVTPPKTDFVRGEPFTLEGGELLVTCLDGSQLRRDFSTLSVYRAPDMDRCGTQTVLLYDSNYLQVELEIRIREK